MRTYLRGKTVGEYTPWLKDMPGSDQLYGTTLSDYINKAEVRAAMNIPNYV